MSDGLSALSSHLIPGRFGKPGELGVVIQEIKDFNLFQFAAWPETLDQAGGMAAKIIGAKAAPGPGQSINANRGALLRIEPLKWWLLTASAQPTCLPSVDAKIGSALDLSHSRTWLSVKGSNAKTLLNHHLPIDLRPVVFTEGSVVSTAFHHVGVTLYFSNNEFNLLLPRSFAASLCEILSMSSLQYGLEVKPIVSSLDRLNTT